MRLIGCLLYSIVAFYFAWSGSWAQFLIVLLLPWVIKMGKMQSYMYNPYNVIITTLVSFLLYCQPIGGLFFAELSFKTQSLIMFSLSSIICGFYVCDKFKIKPIKIGRHSENFFFVFGVGLLPTLISLYLFGNILDMTGDDMIETKSKMTLPFVGQLTYWLPASILVACKKNNNRWLFVSTFASFVAALMTVTKTGMLMAFLFLSVGMSVFKPNIVRTQAFYLLKKYVFVLAPILVISFFSYNNNIRQEADLGTEMEYVQRAKSSIFVKTDNLGQSMFLNYLYYCSPWSNLDYNIKFQHEKGWGCNTFAQFAHLLRLPENRIEKLNPTFLNTHTFLTDYYIDFGFVGAVVASFLLGVFIFFCYRKFGCSDDPLLLAFYVLIMFATVMLFFSNHFNNGYLLNYFLTFVGYSYIYRNIIKI